jgi:hypothetical protein
MSDTEKMMAVIRQKFPHSYHLFDDLEEVCGVIKTQNRGKAHVEFDAQGIDRSGNIIVKLFRVGLSFFRKEEKAC